MMQRPHRFLFFPLLALLGVLALSPPVNAANPPDPLLTELQHLTTYDAQAPLDVKEVRSERRGVELTDDVESSRDAMRRTAAFLNEHLGP